MMFCGLENHAVERCQGRDRSLVGEWWIERDLPQGLMWLA